MRVVVISAVVAALGAGAAAWGSAGATSGEIFYAAGGKGTFVRADGSGSRTPRVGRGDRAHYVGDGGPVAFSPDGRRIAYPCSPNLTRRAWHHSLCVENVGGTGLRRLTHAPRNSYVGDLQPAWSRDGTRIAFVRSLVVRNRPVYRIAVVNANGTGERLVPEPTHCREYHESRWPTWGPRGELVYDCENSWINKGPMITLDPARAAVPTPCVGSRPQFSPDGTRILVSEVDGAGIASFSADARWTLDGLPEATCDWQRITGADDPTSVSAVWSPDGTAVAFLEHDQRDLYVVGVDGSGLRRLVRSRAAIDLAIAWLP